MFKDKCAIFFFFFAVMRNFLHLPEDREKGQICQHLVEIERIWQKSAETGRIWQNLVEDSIILQDLAEFGNFLPKLDENIIFWAE